MLLTGDRGGYYEEFGAVADLAKAYHRPFVHDGQYSTFRKRRFGAPAGDRPPEQFVVFDQNHDQVGNRAFGDRLPAPARPLAAFCTLLSPFVPMLFMGEEYGEPAPFQFFSDHIDEEIAVATRDGRRREFAAFAEFAGQAVPDPQDPATFERSKLTRERDEARRGALRHTVGSAPRAARRRGRHRLRRGRALADRRPRALPAGVQLRRRAARGARRRRPRRDRARHRARRRRELSGDGTVALPALSGALLR